MAIEEKGMTIPDGIDDVLASLPSSIPPEMFDEDESSTAMPAIPRATLPRPMPPPLRMKTPPPLPARARGGAVPDENRIAILEPAPGNHRPSQRPTLTPDVLAALPSVDPTANDRARLESPSSMSAVVVPAAFDSRQDMVSFPIEASEDDIVLPGVARPSLKKKLFVFALAGVATFVVVQKVEKKLSVAVAAPPVAAVSPAPTQAHPDPPPAIVDTPPATTQPNTQAAQPERAPTTASPSDRGSIDTAGTLAGRRVFVDGHVVGQTPGAMLVKCGPHKVKVGSAGHAQKIDVPCGGSIAVGDF